MAHHNELLVSLRDAETLAQLLGRRRQINAPDAEAANALADVLMEARLVPQERLPENRVTMNSRVTYEEKPGGTRRTIVLVHPVEANAAAGRISVLSPIGRALIGRGAGAIVDAGAPSGRDLSVHILSAEKLPS